MAATFEAALAMHERRVLGLAYRLLGSTEDARDAGQEVFLRLFREWGKVGEVTLAAWLYRVTANVCFDARRRRRPAVDLDSAPEIASREESPEKALAAAQRREVLLDEIQKLPERERMAVLLREIEGFDTAEVAAMMGSAEVTVRSQIFSARARLKRALERRLSR